MSSIISVQNISKQYRLGQIGTGSIKHDLQRWWDRARGREDRFLRVGETNDRSSKSQSEYVWALKDISFEVQPGEVLGIIGRNGAGKSTLLKILSRVTEPTTGSIKMHGRVASLLEVGTGMHPDLTGRENIYLNGAILGMRKKEIDNKLEEIIDFSGVERYIDTPVKRYSSGMHVRLGFAVAAHLEPEILIVDEVLAVGDAEFQKKCLGKMKDVSANHGRTVLFVSHNMTAVQNLCNKCMYLFDGLLHYPPEQTNKIIGLYKKNLQEQTRSIPIKDRKDREGEGTLKIADIKILDEQRKDSKNILSGDFIVFSIDYCSNDEILDSGTLEFSISINRNAEQFITLMNNKHVGFTVPHKKGMQSINFVVPKLPLMAGTYSLNIMIRKNNIIQDWIQEVIFFDVEEGDFYKTGISIPQSHIGTYFEYLID